MLSDQIKQYLAERYNLEVTSLELLRSYTNEVYLITSKQDKFILKLYPKIWRNEDKVLWEVDLVNYLSSKGVPVAKVINSRDIKVNFENKDYSALLFEYAKGDKPQSPFSLDLQYNVGKTAALIHKEADGFSSNHKRQEFNLDYLIDNSILVAEKKLLNKEDLNLYKELGTLLKTQINIFIEQGLDWGIVHGDLTLDNLHVTPNDEIIFYDFDSSGFGFRAMELYGWTALFPDKKATREAFLRGYQEIRNINEINIEVAPFLQAAQDMWLSEGMKAISDSQILKQQIDKVYDWKQYFRDLD